MARFRLEAAGMGLALTMFSTQVGAQQAFLGASVVGVRPTTSAFSQVAVWPVRHEAGTLSAQYERDAGWGSDLRMGLLVPRRGRWSAGVGVAVSYARHRPRALVSVTVPHPLVFGRVTTGLVQVDTLRQSDLASHLEGILQASARRLTMAFFAGPSRVRMNQALVSDARVQERLVLSPDLPYSIEVSEVRTGNYRTSAWGYHLGADATAWLHAGLGVGAMVRYSRAQGNIANAPQRTANRDETTEQHRLGGLSLGVGARVRF